MAVTLSGKLGTTGHPTPKTLSGKLGTTGHPQKKLGTQKRPKHLIRASAGAQWCPVSRKKRSIRARGKRV